MYIKIMNEQAVQLQQVYFLLDEVDFHFQHMKLTKMVHFDNKL